MLNGFTKKRENCELIAMRKGTPRFKYLETFRIDSTTVKSVVCYQITSVNRRGLLFSPYWTFSDL